MTAPHPACQEKGKPEETAAEKAKREEAVQLLKDGKKVRETTSQFALPLGCCRRKL